jgi:hypothetical protein
MIAFDDSAVTKTGDFDVGYLRKFKVIPIEKASNHLSED